MAAWGYEFCLLVLKVSLTRSLRYSKIKFVSPRGHVISSIYIAENVISCSLTSLTSFLTPGNAEVV